MGETARLLGAHKNTVRGWLKSGLEPIDQRRPILIRGQQLAHFLGTRRQRRRQPCRPGEFYCFHCRMPKNAAAGKADYLALAASSGNLRARCIDCGTGMYRRVSLRKLAFVAGNLRIALPEAQQHITDTATPSPNCDLEQESDIHADAPPRERAD